MGFPLGTWLVTRKYIQRKFTAGPISIAISSLAVGSLLYNSLKLVTEDTFLRQGSPTTEWLRKSTENIPFCSTRQSPTIDRIYTNQIIQTTLIRKRLVILLFRNKLTFYFITLKQLSTIYKLAID